MTGATSQPLHHVRFANEDDDYREARNALLSAEIELRRQTEHVAALRRQLPDGGHPPEDYVFDERSTDGQTRKVRLSQLFGDKDTLVLYSFMYGPDMGAACPSCTSILDSLDGTSDHARQRIAFAVVAKSPLERIAAYAAERGWSHLRLLSSAGNAYNRDYKGESDTGGQLPSLNVFTRRNGEVRHFYNSELLFVASDPGQEPRHVDAVWPLWNLFDLTPIGRGDFHPARSYASGT